MNITIPPVYLYLPKKLCPPSLPLSPNTYWQWQNENQGKYRSGKYNWTLQTYLYLKQSGFPCELTDVIPEEGIVIFHYDCLIFHLKPGPKVLFVCIQADRPRLPYCQIHIIQNAIDAARNTRKGLSKQWVMDRYYIPYWSQPELIPRNPAREDRFENVAFFGLVENLAPELRKLAWQEQLAQLGFKWRVVEPDQWNDYSDVDVVVGVRSFDYQGQFLRKPSSKLVNAWQAGVPAILGRESSFKAQSKSNLDYIEVTSVKELISALQLLRDDQSLRRAIVENGHFRAADTTPEKILAEWQHFLINVAFPTYYQWRLNQPWNRPIFLVRRYIKLKSKNFLKLLKGLATRSDTPEEKFKQTHWK